MPYRTDVVGVGGQLFLVRQMAEQEEVRDHLVVELGKVVDVVAPVLQDALVTVDVGDTGLEDLDTFESLLDIIHRLTSLS